MKYKYDDNIKYYHLYRYKHSFINNVINEMNK